MAIEGSGRSVVVTGAGSGIGYATTLLLLDRGYRVSACDVVAGRLDGCRREGLTFHRVDVRDRSAIEAAIAAEERLSSGTCGLVNCAGIFKRMPFLELDEETWDRHFAVNLKGAFLACQAVLPRLRRNGGGSIVLFASSLARTGSPGGAHYAATKGGVLGLARSLALEVARDNIRVNAISPGITDTPMPRSHRSEEDFLARAKTIPLGRYAMPEEIAEAVLFLLGDDSTYVTGQDIRINGGSQIS